MNKTELEIFKESLKLSNIILNFFKSYLNKERLLINVKRNSKNRIEVFVRSKSKNKIHFLEHGFIESKRPRNISSPPIKIDDKIIGINEETGEIKDFSEQLKKEILHPGGMFGKEILYSERISRKYKYYYLSTTKGIYYRIIK